VVIARLWDDADAAAAPSASTATASLSDSTAGSNNASHSMRWALGASILRVDEVCT
jgi:hypothetical protein